MQCWITYNLIRYFASVNISELALHIPLFILLASPSVYVQIWLILTVLLPFGSLIPGLFQLPVSGSLTSSVDLFEVFLNTEARMSLVMLLSKIPHVSPFDLEWKPRSMQWPTRSCRTQLLPVLTSPPALPADLPPQRPPCSSPSVPGAPPPEVLTLPVSSACLCLFSWLLPLSFS